MKNFDFKIYLTQTNFDCVLSMVEDGEFDFCLVLLCRRQCYTNIEGVDYMTSEVTLD